MAQFLAVHARNPQPRLISQAVEIIRAGGLLVYPTDSCYALGCQIGNKAAMDRIRRIRGIDAQHHLTLVCRDLSELGQYATVDNTQYRALKAATPGRYTFILKASREVPKRLLNPRRKTIGLRVPDHPVVHALLHQLQEPMLSSTLLLPGDEFPLNDDGEIRDRLDRKVDVILYSGSCGVDMTTVVDLTSDLPLILRQGRGSTAPFGTDA